MNAGLQYGLYLALLAVLAWPLGKYLYKVMNGERVLLTPVLRPIEKGIYRLLRIDENEDMGWKQYAVVCVLFNLFGFLALWAMQLLQSVLPLNPEGMPGTSWHLGFNTAASFMTNTNWQAYSGETTLSYVVYESPHKETEADMPDADAPDTASPCTENSYMVSPDMATPRTDAPDTENPAQLNTHVSNTYETNTQKSNPDPILIQKQRAQRADTGMSDEENEFVNGRGLGDEG